MLTFSKMVSIDISKHCILFVWLTSKQAKGPFGLAYFRAYIKHFMQINKFLCITYKFLR